MPEKNSRLYGLHTVFVKNRAVYLVVLWITYFYSYSVDNFILSPYTLGF